MIRPLVIIGSLLFGAASTAAAGIDDATEQLVAAAAILEASESARDRIDGLTQAIRAYEAGLSELRGEIRKLTLRERALQAQLADENADISALVAMMQSATHQAKAQSLLHPGSAADTIRAGSLASALVPELRARAEVLENQLTELSDIQDVLGAARAQLETGVGGIRSARNALASALTARGDLPPRIATDEAAMQALINSAATLSALADNFQSTRTPVSGGTETRWTAPVQGRILVPFGATDASGAPTIGWSVSAAADALITSPTEVTVRFSGEIPKNGLVVILEADNGYLITLAGLSGSFVVRDQVLKSGDPVGFLGTWSHDAQDNLNAGQQDTSLIVDEKFYIEVRRNGAPVDPATVMTLEKEQG